MIFAVVFYSIFSYFFIINNERLDKTKVLSGKTSIQTFILMYL